jgi:hypothetical protein
MGAWGAGTFDNDTATDWSYGLEDVDDLSLVRETIEGVLAAGSTELDAGEAMEGLAACEVVARLKGNHGVQNVYTEIADQWVKQHASLSVTNLIEPALAAIDRILTEPSELLELWQEDDPGEWLADVAGLRARVAN